MDLLIHFVAASALITTYLWRYYRKLLENRVKAGPRAEKERSQKRIQLLASTSADKGQTAVVAAEQFKTLGGQISAWRAQRTRSQLLDQAKQLAQADIAALTADHARLEAEAKQSASIAAQPKVAGAPAPSKVDQLQRMAEQRLKEDGRPW